MTYWVLAKEIRNKFLRCLRFLSFFTLFVVVNCKKEEIYPIPSFGATHPDWGPNNLIVFVNNPEEVIPPETPFPPSDYPRGLWVVNSEGSQLKSLAQKTPDGIVFTGAPDWSPDGKWIVTNDDIGRIWLVSAEGDSFIQITQRRRKIYPSFSPDGKKIAFSTPDSDAVGIRGVRILDLETGRERFVFPYGREPSWSPDGSKLVFSGWVWEDNRWIGGMVVTDTLGNNARLLVRYEAASVTNGTPSFSPDGSKIVFHKESGEYTEKRIIGNIWVVNADGRNLRKLTKKGGLWPSWSPDGKKIIYMRTPRYEVWRGGSKILPQEGAGDLYIINADGSGEKRLTFFYPR